ncbi:FAD-dependent oxidoreductase [Mesorhizobium sp. CO1-1-8]|uniref:FAD-dependent oxidoreductase n=1 Tax=Mesorhizobium sp. CO1-1-8 TaxID=2876631 RepID=UPI001CD0A2F7|nr:FAD-dependent oxidoreductase [Mesorhizobium sp. CO1-1-8]MBZ9772424.1 FAD-dependent oxidoreductase [Mesorhizobium sp. CO1-1-8]
MPDVLNVDVLIAGSGAGGLATAVTAGHHGLKILVLEKEAVIGGTTARSAGWVWIPNSSQARTAGVADSLDAALTYLRHEAGTFFDEAKCRAFLEHAPEMLRFFERDTAVKFTLGSTFPDYHAEQPGGLAGGRSLHADEYNTKSLGRYSSLIALPLPESTFLGMMVAANGELRHFFQVVRSIDSFLYVMRRLALHMFDVAWHGQATQLKNGRALVGRLLRSALDVGVDVRTNAPLRELCSTGGLICGATAEIEGRVIEIRARKGVVLATGGFPHNTALQAQLYPHVASGSAHWSPSSPGNVGDGLQLGLRAGGVFRSDFPNAAAWAPMSLAPRRDGTLGLVPHVIDRGKPGVLAVRADGRRFVNEANSYHDFTGALIRSKADDTNCQAWLVTDHATIRKYGLGIAKPSPMPIGHHIRSGYLIRAKSLAELARQAGIDPTVFQVTIDTYNRDARSLGEDRSYGRGTTAYNRYMGDAGIGPNPCVGPVEVGPFYAVRVVPGDLGTFAGLATDRYARVIDADGKPILALYAVGNDAASIMGGNYPGGGITLGPALTFGYIAGLHMSSSR